jgi:cell division protein FtsB
MRSFLRPAVLCLLTGALVATAAAPAALAAPSVAKLRHRLAKLRRQNAALQADRTALKLQVTTLKGQVAFENVQNSTLATTNTALTANNTTLTSENSTLSGQNSALSAEVSAAQATLGGTGDLPTQLAALQLGLAGSTTSTLTADISALQTLVAVQGVPQTPSLFSPAFVQANASVAGDLQSQLSVFLQEFNSGNFAKPSNNRLTFTVGASAPASLGALFSAGNPTTS